MYNVAKILKIFIHLAPLFSAQTGCHAASWNATYPEMGYNNENITGVIDRPQKLTNISKTYL